MFDKLKQLSKDTAVYGISTMFGRFLNFILVPFYTNIFLPSEYGIITNIYAFISLLNIFFIYGMDSAYLKFAALPVEETPVKKTFSTSFNSVFIVSILLGSALILFRENIMTLLGVPAGYHYLMNFVVPILILDALAVLPFIELRLEKKSKRFALFKILNIVINVSFNLILILLLKWGIEAVLISNLIASAATLFLVMPVIAEKYNFNIKIKLLTKLLKFGLPYLPAGLGAMIIQVIDRPILEKLTDLKTLGIYQANYKLGIFMMLFVSMFQYAWQPFFLEESKQKNAKDIFSKVLSYFTIAGSIILVVITLFINNIVSINIAGKYLIHPNYWSGLSIVPIILFSYLFYGFYIIFTAGIYIKEKSIYVPLITGLGAVVNIAANFLLIPKYNIMGAAFATLASYFSMSIAFYFVTQQIYRIEYEFLRMFKILSAVIVTGILYYILYFGGILNFLYKIILLSAFILYLIKFVIYKSELITLKKNILKQ